MSRSTITITVDHHPGTPAIRRLLDLLAWASTGYGIRTMDVAVTDDDE